MDHFSKSSRFPPFQHKTHQDATRHNTNKYPSSSLADARFTSVLAARAREARDIYSVSIVNFGTELGRCSTIHTTFPIFSVVIKSAGLTVPRIFSLLSSWFFSFCCSQRYFVSMCLIVPFSCGKLIHALLQHLSRFVFVLCVQALVCCWLIQVKSFICTAYNAVVL